MCSATEHWDFDQIIMYQREAYLQQTHTDCSIMRWFEMNCFWSGVMAALKQRDKVRFTWYPMVAYLALLTPFQQFEVSTWRAAMLLQTASGRPFQKSCVVRRWSWMSAISASNPSSTSNDFESSWLPLLPAAGAGFDGGALRLCMALPFPTLSWPQTWNICQRNGAFHWVSWGDWNTYNLCQSFSTRQITGLF